ncbi:hypothetical protein EE612_047728, partial [Oryza sativa]
AAILCRADHLGTCV